MPSPELDTSCFHVLDGGFATTLSENLDDPSEVMKHDPLWSSGRVLTDPEGVRAVHRAFLKAGARIIETATYQCSKEMYMKHLEQLEGKEEEAIKMFGWALQCADQVSDSFLDLASYFIYLCLRLLKKSSDQEPLHGLLVVLVRMVLALATAPSTLVATLMK